MKRNLLSIITLTVIILVANYSNAVAQCPGCITDMSFTITPAAPGITPDTLPDGIAGQYYDEDVSIYLPAEFNTQGFDVTLTKLEVLSVAGLPFGMSFQSSSSNNTFFPSQNPPTTEHACAKICGTAIFPGQYNMVVFVRAYVNTVIGNQTSDDSFSIPITILPGSSGNASFSIINGTGCGSVTASFETNLPSNGMNGYTYNWSFGNGTTSSLETPPNITYSTPGQYTVNCQTTIDTLSFNYLNNVTVLGTSCSDFLGTPDLYVKIKNQAGTTIHTTAMVENTDPPVSFTIPGLQLYHNQTYSFEVWDEDGGLAGADDHCKTFQVPGTSQSNSMWSGSDGISFVTSRPVLSFNDSATVTVYPQPAQPVVSAVPATGACIGDSILLSATNAAVYQWHNDTSLLVGASQQSMYVHSTGKYFVVITDSNGCQAQSDTATINFYNNPPKPTFWRQGDTLRTLLAGFNLQWYFEGNPINGATAQTCFISATGNYHLIATTTQGCETSSDTVFYQPFNNSIDAINTLSDFVLFPNPNTGVFTIRFNCSEAQNLTIVLNDMLGRKVYSETLINFTGSYEKELTAPVSPSLYILELHNETTVLRREKVVVQ